MTTPDSVPTGTLWEVAKYALGMLRKVKITFPADNEILLSGLIEFRGSCRFRLGGQFVLFHRDGNQYWPHGRLYFHATIKSWKAEFTVPEDYPKDTLDVVVVEINEVTSSFVNYYYEQGRATKVWKPIVIEVLGRGFELRDEVKIHVKRRQLDK